MTGTVRLERKGTIAIVTFDRPERRNAFNESMWGALEKTVVAIARDMPRAVVVTGAGEKAFCAGFDVNPDNPQVSSLIDAVGKHNPVPVEALVRRFRNAVDGLVSLPVPVIAAINGIAYGGGAELAMRCDMRIADPGAVICFSEVRLGLMPDWGGGPALARLAGPAVASDLILTAREVRATEALSLGIINRISAPGMARDEAVSIAGTIAGHGPRAVRCALSVIRRTSDLAFEEALEMETREAVALIASGECIHGIEAFLMRKKPEFPDPSE